MSGSIHIVGLGSGDPDQISLGAWRTITRAGRLYVRTGRHPALRLLEAEGIPFQSFDAVYEAKASFPEVYEAIVDALTAAASSGEAIVYAVPGHPMVAEATVARLRERCPQLGIALTLQGGESFLDQAFARFGFDPIEGLQLQDGLSLQASALRPELHTLIGQVYDRDVASEVKLTLMERFPDDYPLVVAHALGVQGEEKLRRVPLYELDRLESYGDLTLVYVPRTDDPSVRGRSFHTLEETVRILRSPGGCPWDREQTHSSLRKNLIEETYEVLETIDDDDPEAMCEELGDLLLQVMLHAQMEAETGTFTVWDVVERLNLKLIRRHPHVFGERTAGNAEEAMAAWNDMKAEEKRGKAAPSAPPSVLSGVPRELPGVMKAWKLQEKASSVGFDWDRPELAAEKVKEELREVLELEGEGREQHLASEIGDLLFAVVNLARLYRVDPEEAIARTNRKFVQRFHFIEEQLRLKGATFDQTDLEEMETFWEKAKEIQGIRER